MTHAGSGASLLLTAGLGLAGLRLFGTAPDAAAGGSYLCPARSPTACPWLSFNSTEATLRYALKPSLPELPVARHRRERTSERFGRRRQAGQQPVVLHVGAHDLSGIFGDSDRIAQYRAWGPQTILVEPNPRVAAQLMENLELLGINGTSKVVQAAVCPNHMGDVKFFAVPGGGSMASSLLQAAAESTARAWGLGRPEELAVRCVTPSALLRELALDPRALDELVVDAEGVDVELVARFLELEGLLPAVLQFEWEKLVTLHRENGTGFQGERRVMDVVDALVARGYDAFEDGFDVVGVLAL